jgi:hypothetical protein
VDRSPIYLWTLIAFVLISAVILGDVGGEQWAVHYRMSTGASDFMGAVLGMWSGAALFGAASGTRRFRPHSDLRDNLAIQQWALLPIVLSASVFDVAIAMRPGGPPIEVVILLAALIVGLCWTAVDFHRETRRLTAEFHRCAGVP